MVVVVELGGFEQSYSRSSLLIFTSGYGGGGGAGRYCSEQGGVGRVMWYNCHIHIIVTSIPSYLNWMKYI